MSETQKTTTNASAPVQEIDLLELARKVWSGRKFILKVCGYAALAGLLIGFSIPRSYTTSVMLAPESANRGLSGAGGLAAMVGINISQPAGEDALSPQLYPDIISSTPFLLELFDVRVQDTKGRVDTTLYAYMDEYQRAPWWSAVIGAPFKLLGWGIGLITGNNKKEQGDMKVDPFYLTRDQLDIAKALAKSMAIGVDKKTGVISLEVTMQDPLISATVTDTVMHKLQNYITDYRTRKARHDLAYAETLYAEAKSEYTKAQSNYARFVDANQNIVLLSYRAEQERLQNEVNLAYGVYSQVAQQVQVAKAKVQEITPVYAVVQPPSVPLSPSAPRKMMILIGFIFMGGVFSVGWILFLKDLSMQFSKKERVKG
ncbi:MAG: chain-length determining protein [Prevotellaceae bacterium]|jgi:uncharacterized protein involved in exopolysaccharide biosynthesis|nr:chain-length determining protein [Prevotellaceae bacterium]